MSLSSELFTDKTEENKEFVKGEIAIHDKVFVIGNSVYQISNISYLSVHDLSSTKPIPKPIFYIGVAFLFVLFFLDGLLSLIIGLVLLATGAYVFYKYWQDKNISKYALMLYLNSGSLMSILSDSDLFLKKIAVSLLRVMNHEETKNMIFNLDNRMIFDGVSDSVINFGDVEGDILNYVKKS